MKKTSVLGSGRSELKWTHSPLWPVASAAAAEDLHCGSGSGQRQKLNELRVRVTSTRNPFIPVYSGQAQQPLSLLFVASPLLQSLHLLQKAELGAYIAHLGVPPVLLLRRRPISWTGQDCPALLPLYLYCRRAMCSQSGQPEDQPVQTFLCSM